MKMYNQKMHEAADESMQAAEIQAVVQKIQVTVQLSKCTCDP